MTRSSYSTPYLVLSIASVIAVSAVFLVFWPSLQNIKSYLEQTQSVQKEISAKKNELASLQNKYAILELNREKEKELNIMLPTEENVEDILRLIDKSASASGVSIDSITDSTSGARSYARSERARDSENALPEGAMPVQLQVQSAGTYQQIRNFLTEIDNSIRLAEVRKISMQRSDTNPDSIRADITLFYFTSSAKAE